MHKHSLAIVLDDHLEHHDGHNCAEPRIAETYYIHNLREKVQQVGGNNCSTCAVHEPIKKKPVDPILTTRRGQLVMFDLTKFIVPVHTTLIATHTKPTSHTNRE
jgi:hypothetical protein